MKKYFLFILFFLSYGNVFGLEIDFDGLFENALENSCKKADFFWEQKINAENTRSYGKA
ncbi:MAG: hypothetical protein ABIA74_03530 [bacterium]